MCALIQVEDILSICYENYDVINNSNRIFIILGTCSFIMSYLRKILHSHVLFVEYNSSVKLKDHSFPNIGLC